MRFRAAIAHEQLLTFTNHIKLLSEVSKTCIVHLSTASIRSMSISEDDTLLTYTTLDTDRIFAEFRIESKNDNVISLEIMLPNMLHALKSGASAHSVIFKLTKRMNTPFLAVHTQVVEGGVVVMQEIPVRVLGAAEMARYAEPNIPVPTAQLCVPSLRSIQPVVDRMKAFGKTIRLEADMPHATLAVSVASDTVALKTFLRGLSRGDADPATTVVETAVVSSRTLAKVLKAASPLQLEMLLCICPGNALVLHFASEGYTVTFILSLLDSGADDE